MKKLLLVEVPDEVNPEGHFNVIFYPEMAHAAPSCNFKIIAIPTEEEKLKYIANLSIGKNMQSSGVESRLKAYDKWLTDKILNQ